MKKSELKQIIKEEIKNELKDKFNKAINSTYENFILTIGKEYEEVFSRKLFNLFEKYKEQFGEKHPLEFEWGKNYSLNELSESQNEKNYEYFYNRISKGVDKFKQMLRDNGHID